MKAHLLDVVGRAMLSRNPSVPLEAAPKQYVDMVSAGGIFITDIEPTSNGIVSAKEYFTGTIPENILVENAITNTSGIRVHFIAEPSNSVFGVQVQVNGIDAVVEQDPESSRLYKGYADINISLGTENHTITAISSTGKQWTTNISVLVGGPSIQSLTMGLAPAAQTAVKENDEISIAGTVPNSATGAKVLDYGVSGDEHALTLGTEDSAGVGFKTLNGTITVSSRTGLHRARVIAHNFIGTDGNPADSSNQHELDQTYPSFEPAAFLYPAGQLAIKNTESVSVTQLINDADDYEYETSNGLNVGATNIFEATKVVTRVDGSPDSIDYSIANDNYTITATRTRNGATSIKQIAINVVNVAPTAQITWLGGHNRLQSSPTGSTYTLKLNANQKLLREPDGLEIIIGGTSGFSGTWSPEGEDYLHDFDVYDNSPRGTYTFSNMIILGMSGIQGTVITAGSQVEIGGISLRDITFPALSRIAPIGTTVSDVSKLVASYKDSSDLVFRSNTDDVPLGFTITNSIGVYTPVGDHIMISDVTFAGSNTSGTLTLTLEETE